MEVQQVEKRVEAQEAETCIFAQSKEEKTEGEIWGTTLVAAFSCLTDGYREDEARLFLEALLKRWGCKLPQGNFDQGKKKRWSILEEAVRLWYLHSGDAKKIPRLSSSWSSIRVGPVLNGYNFLKSLSTQILELYNSDVIFSSFTWSSLRTSYLGFCLGAGFVLFWFSLLLLGNCFM